MSRGTLDSASCNADFMYGTFTLSGLPSQTVPLTLDVLFAVLTPKCTHFGLGSSAFARRYLRNRCFFLFLRLLRCFSSAGSLPCVMYWRMDDRSHPAGFPHSDIHGSMDICSSPWLFAAYHVFLRLLVPRHPPHALPRLSKPEVTQ